MKDSAVPTSALMLPHPWTTYPTPRGNQVAVSSTIYHLVDISVLSPWMTMRQIFLQEYQAVVESSKVML